MFLVSLYLTLESKGIIFTVLHRGVEQLVARRAHNPKVAGSNPVPATKRLVSLTLAGLFFFMSIDRTKKFNLDS